MNKFEDCYNKFTLQEGIFFCFVMCEAPKKEDEDTEAYSEDLQALMGKKQKKKPEYDWQEFLLNPSSIHSIRPIMVKPFDKPVTHLEYGHGLTATICMHVDDMAGIWATYNSGVTSIPDDKETETNDTVEFVIAP